MTAATAPTDGVLTRRLRLSDAVVIGLASMIGAGAFVSLGAAQDLAGSLAPIAVLIAAAVALCNATSTAQLAAQHPSSGGAYHFGGKQLGPRWGFLAGWCFVIGKVASCAAMALVIAAYLVPEPAQRIAAAAIVVVVTGVNLVGITRTASLARVLVSVALTALVLTGFRLLAGFVGLGGLSGGVAGPMGGPTDPSSDPTGPATAGAQTVAGSFAAGSPGPLAGTSSGLWDGGLAAVLGAGAEGAMGLALAVAQAAALMFFAFAGYARVATLGEEVVEPRRTIPRAILIALAVVCALYLALSIMLVAVGPAPGERGWGPAPFLTALESVGAGGVWRVIVTIGAAAAATGALLALVAGVSRTMLAMAREGDLPRPLARISDRFSVPQRAEVSAALVVVLLVLLASDVLVAITASSFGVLLYYAVANLAAFTQTGQWRLFPKVLQILGLLGCLALVAALPGRTIVAGLALVAAGFAYRALVRATHRA